MINTSLIKFLCVVFCCMFAWTALAGIKPAPKFEDYAATSIFIGKPAKVILSTPETKLYRTRLREAATGPATFAGEYVLAVFGCGTGCISGAVISLKTGRVVFFPGSVSTWYGDGEMLEYRSNSNLLVASGMINESGQIGRHYYEFTGKAFKHLTTSPCTPNEDRNACLEQ